MVDNRGFVDYILLIALGGLGLYNILLACRLYKLYGELYYKHKAAEKELAECRNKLRDIAKNN